MQSLIDRFLTPVFVVSMTILMGYFAFCYFVIFGHPTAEKDVVTTILTTLQNAGFVVTVSYWIGTSASSASKDAVISKAVPVAPPMVLASTGSGESSTVATKTAETAAATAETAASTAAVAEATAKKE